MAEGLSLSVFPESLAELRKLPRSDPGIWKCWMWGEGGEKEGEGRRSRAIEEGRTV